MRSKFFGDDRLFPVLLAVPLIVSVMDWRHGYVLVIALAIAGFASRLTGKRVKKVVTRTFLVVGGTLSLLDVPLLIYASMLEAAYGEHWPKLLPSFWPLPLQLGCFGMVLVTGAIVREDFYED